ncbi:hypothetical protein COS75_03510 [Candidatus Pacearchaeota archaeon CG06_land_8_20_14_3_00_35_12]|nr:MAG: hypothetical protein COS75_03510 [Candidatus Pacearchaeota archaeon CG06_land_8_20_14_3_00_35_12]
MLNKRGQITLYIIIAIVIVAAVLFFVFLMPKIQEAGMTEAQAKAFLESRAPQLKNYVQDCMKTTARKSINTLGRQGGYIIPRPARIGLPYAVMSDAPIMNYALFYDKNAGENVNLLPSINEMQTELSNFMTVNLDFYNCVGNFGSFKNQMEITPGILTIQNSTFGNNIIITFSYPLTIKKGKASMIVDNYAVSIPIDLVKIRDVAAQVVNGYMTGKNPIVIESELARIIEINLRTNPDSEIMSLGSSSYSEIPSDSAGVIYNSKNTLYKIEYNRMGLDKTFSFYFLVGSESW